MKEEPLNSNFLFEMKTQVLPSFFLGVTLSKSKSGSEWMTLLFDTESKLNV